MNPIYAQLARKQREFRTINRQPGSPPGGRDADQAYEHAPRSEDTTRSKRRAAGRVQDLSALELYFEREDVVEHLYRVLNHRKGGRASVVILHGDGSSGKSTIVRRGVLPKFRKEFDGVFLAVTLSPQHGDTYRSMIGALAAAVIDQLPTRLDGGAAPAENKRRLRHFEMLAAGEAGEAAEYLAALFREAHIDDGPVESARCLLYFDPLDRFFPKGLITEASESWIGDELLPLMEFFQELALTNSFPLMLAVRSFNVDGLRLALADASRRLMIDWLAIKPLPPGSLSALVDHDATLPDVEPALVARCEELLEKHPGALAFLEDTWRAQASLQRPPLTLEFFENERPLEKIIAGAAEAAVAPLWDSSAADTICTDSDAETTGDSEVERGFLQLMDMFFPVPEGDAPVRAGRLPYARLADRPGASVLVEALTEARVLHPSGDDPESATIEWSVPRFFRHWQRGYDWLQKDRELRETVQQLQTDVRAWEKADRTVVLLMHGTASLKLARELLGYDRDRAFLSDQMREYLDMSIATDLRLRPRPKGAGRQSAEASGLLSDRSGSTSGGLMHRLRNLLRR